MTYIVIVTGWRGANECHAGRVVEGLEPVLAKHNIDVILRHGKCPYGGVDLIADGIARGWRWRVEEYPPDIVDGRVQGPARNRAMCAADPKADIVIGFPGPGSRGTWDCLRWAQRYDIPFRGYPLQVTR